MKIMIFVKELRSAQRRWKVGDKVEAWRSEHVAKCYNVRSLDNPDIATLAVPEYFLKDA